MNINLKKKVKELPLVAGIYIMKSDSGEVLYVGKSSSLRKRVSSYFSSPVNKKTDMLLENVADIEYVKCDTPEQALLLEAALIKERKPKYNIALKDDKSYPSLAITKQKFPRIFICRAKNKSKDAALFGPYTHAGSLKTALNIIRKIFPFCSCRRMPQTPCLYYHLKLCPAPCAGKISPNEYKENIENIRRLLKGERKNLIKHLGRKMKEFAQKQEFEKAAWMRDCLLAVQGLYRGKFEKPELLSLKDTLDLPRLPFVIEAIDISSLSGSNPAGSVVAFRAGIADKDNYRRYRIKQVEGIDDYAMMAEVVKRRYLRLKTENKRSPDLIIIDGGKGHTDRVSKELSGLELNIPVIGIAKQNEEIWFPDKDVPLIIPKDNSCLHLIQRIRDEAHRFAHGYHLLRRKKHMLEEK